VSGATETVDGTKKYRGAAVIAGVPQFTSVSALELAHQCLRRWWYRYVDPRKFQSPPTKASKRGTDGHERIAHFLTTGDRSRLNALVMRGMHQLPPPGPDLLVEYDFVPWVKDHPDGKYGLSAALLKAGDIPVIGAMDLVHERRENYGVEDIADAYDEPGIIKLVDHKFTGKLDYAKTSSELVETFQMAGYGLWAFLKFPQLERVRLTHNYFPEKGTPRAPTALVTRDQCERTWMAADAVGVAMRDAARESNPDKVDANTRVCHAFGKPCPAIEVCSAAKFDSLSEWIGPTATESYLTSLGALDEFEMPPEPPAPRFHLPVLNPRGEPAPMATPAAPNSNSLFAFVAQTTAAAPNTAAPQMPGQAPGSFAPTVDQEVARLTAGLAQPAPAPVPPAFPTPAPAPAPAAPVLQVAPPPVQMTTTDYIKAIVDCGLGFPTTIGNAAQFLSTISGQPLAADGSFPGSGELAVYKIPETAMFPAVLDEVRGIAARRAAEAQAAQQTAPSPTQVQSAAPTSVTPPDAPAPNAAALQPMATHAPADDAAAKKAAKEAEKAAKKAEKEAAKAAEKAAKEAAKQAATTAPATVVNNTVVQQVSTTSAPTPVQQSTELGSLINVYADCAVEGLELQSLSPLLNQTFAWMCKDAGTDDFRELPRGVSDSKYSHGKWKGVLTGCLRAAAKAGHILPGNYKYTTTDEVSRVVVEALAEIATSSGGVFVKGAAR
jgi:hypothetical protein